MPMNINLSEHEVSIILSALSKRPYMEVAALIRKIVEQTTTEERRG